MSDLDTQKLHVRFAKGVTPDGPIHPRCYTLTHSDLTGELFLTIGPGVATAQISGWYTRLLRDEMIACWEVSDTASLHVHCHVSGGLVIGSAGWRDAIFRRHLPMVLSAFRYGDRSFIDRQPELDSAPVIVHFHAREGKFNRKEPWGGLESYRLLTKADPTRNSREAAPPTGRPGNPTHA